MLKETCVTISLVGLEMTSVKKYQMNDKREYKLIWQSEKKTLSLIARMTEYVILLGQPSMIFNTGLSLNLWFTDNGNLPNIKGLDNLGEIVSTPIFSSLEAGFSLYEVN